MKLFQKSLMISVFVIFFITTALGFVQRKGNKVFIVDRTGVKWDVTQAKRLGFRPEKFQYGIGKTAFTPLDDSNIKQQPNLPGENPRVIGIENESEAHAYSVDRLRYHEIANIHIGDNPITAAY